MNISTKVPDHDCTATCGRHVGHCCLPESGRQLAQARQLRQRPTLRRQSREQLPGLLQGEGRH